MDLRNPNIRPIIVAVVLLGALAQLALLLLVGMISLGDTIAVLQKLFLLSTITTGLIVGLDYLIVKHNIFGRFGRYLGVPQFGGRWEGWKRSELSKDGAWKKISIEIKQGFFITAFEVGEAADDGHQNASQSVTNAEYFSDKHQHRLIYTYSTVRDGVVGRKEEPHEGTFVLNMQKADSKSLTGEYFTNLNRYSRDGREVPGLGTRGSVGFVRLKKRLDGESEPWAMAMPDN